MYAAMRSLSMQPGITLSRSSDAHQWEGPELLVLPVLGMLNVRSAQIRVGTVGLLAGQGLYLRAGGPLRVEPDPMTGGAYLVVSLPRRNYARPDLEAYPTLVDGFDAPWLLELARCQEVTGMALDDRLDACWEQHYQALRRLPGSWSHRTNLYRRLLDARFLLQPPESLGVSDVGNRIHLSRTRLFQLFRVAFGVRPRQHYTRVALLRALNLLAWSSVSITEIAACCGYQDRTAFTRMFAAELGTPPMAVRHRLLAAGGDALAEIHRALAAFRD